MPLFLLSFSFDTINVQLLEQPLFLLEVNFWATYVKFSSKYLSELHPGFTWWGWLRTGPWNLPHEIFRLTKVWVQLIYVLLLKGLHFPQYGMSLPIIFNITFNPNDFSTFRIFLRIIITADNLEETDKLLEKYNLRLMKEEIDQLPSMKFKW